MIGILIAVGIVVVGGVVGLVTRLCSGVFGSSSSDNQQRGNQFYDPTRTISGQSHPGQTKPTNAFDYYRNRHK